MSIQSAIPSNGQSSPGQLGLKGAASTEESARWFDRAKRVLAGGISSSARSTTTGPLPYPLYITHGHGSRIWDADGNEFIDYLLSYGSVVLGTPIADSPKCSIPSSTWARCLERVTRWKSNSPSKSAAWFHAQSWCDMPTAAQKR